MHGTDGVWATTQVRHNTGVPPAPSWAAVWTTNCVPLAPTDVYIVQREHMGCEDVFAVRCCLFNIICCLLCCCVCRRDEANEALKAAQEAGNQEEIEKYSKRTVKACDSGVVLMKGADQC
jgi:hypothetical protein